jgi:hypothetical protein
VEGRRILFAMAGVSLFARLRGGTIAKQFYFIRRLLAGIFDLPRQLGK